MESNSETASQILRDNTRAEHEAIEDALPVLKADFTLGAYQDLLLRLYGFYRPVELAIEQSPGLEKLDLSYELRKKSPLLENDLKHFGRVSQQEIEPWFREASAPQVLGILYVLEGSTLGGQTIARHLAVKFSLSAEEGLNFFSSYGDRIGLMWKRFQKELNAKLKLKEDIAVSEVRGLVKIEGGRVQCGAPGVISSETPLHQLLRSERLN